MSMSRKKCCVPGCIESKSSHRTLHKFPNPEKDRERFNKWVFLVKGDIIRLDAKDIYKYRSVCHAHFEEKYCCRYNNLSNIAIPTLNLPGIPLHRFPDPKTNPEIYITWASSIGGLHLQDKKYVYNNLRVCRKHFKAIYLYPPNQLCKLAIPELQLSGPLHTFPSPNYPHEDRFKQWKACLVKIS